MPSAIQKTEYSTYNHTKVSLEGPQGTLQLVDPVLESCDTALQQTWQQHIMLIQ